MNSGWSILISQKEYPKLQTYTVNKIIKEFPSESLNNPENACATIMIKFLQGIDLEKFKSLCGKDIHKYLKRGIEKSPDSVINKALNYKIVKVWQCNDRAGVVVETPKNYLLRFLVLENNSWLNEGESSAKDTNALKLKFTNIITGLFIPERKTINKPDKYLKKYSNYIKSEAKEPKQFILKQLSEKKIVIIGEQHHRQTYWNFNSELIKMPHFTQKTGSIFLELGSNYQHLVDSFLNLDYLDISLPVKVLQEYILTGWSNQNMLDFFKTVWLVNQNLEPNKKIRIQLVDTERIWDGSYNDDGIDRDEYMANQIVKYLSNSDDQRNSLLIVGYFHAVKNISNIAEIPHKSVAWHLCQKIGINNVYSIFPHNLKGNGFGIQDGRLCQGLFDDAFLRSGLNSLIFPLKNSPFGKERFDAMLNYFNTLSNYEDAFDAYLYLSPLEQELWSPMIPGFYGNGFSKEVEKRYKQMGIDWKSRYAYPECNEHFLQSWILEGRTNGKFYHQLGPVNAWHYGDGWKDSVTFHAYQKTLKNPSILKEDLKVVFDYLNSARKIDSIDFIHRGRIISNMLSDKYLNTNKQSNIKLCASLYTHFNKLAIRDFSVIIDFQTKVEPEKHHIPIKCKIIFTDGTEYNKEANLHFNYFAEKWEFDDYYWLN
jgi:hypothetical protein